MPTTRRTGTRRSAGPAGTTRRGVWLMPLGARFLAPGHGAWDRARADPGTRAGLPAGTRPSVSRNPVRANTPPDIDGCASVGTLRGIGPGASPGRAVIRRADQTTMGPGRRVRSGHAARRRPAARGARNRGVCDRCPLGAARGQRGGAAAGRGRVRRAGEPGPLRSRPAHHDPARRPHHGEHGTRHRPRLRLGRVRRVHADPRATSWCRPVRRLPDPPPAASPCWSGRDTVSGGPAGPASAPGGACSRPFQSGTASC